jgi:CBS domain-containing protein
MSGHTPIRVRDVMTQDYQTVDGIMTVRDGVCRMRDTGAVALIVQKRNDDDEYGIVLLSDVAREVLARDRAPERVNIYEIMSKPVIGVDPDMDIRYCTRLFDKFGLSYAPVIDNGELKGIVSYASMVLRGLCRSGEET